MFIFIPNLRKIIFLNFSIILIGSFILLNSNSSLKERLYNDTIKYINIDYKNKAFRPFTLNILKFLRHHMKCISKIKF